MPEGYLKYDNYWKLCQQINPKFTLNEAEILSALLNDMGIMLNFSKDERIMDTRVLKPQWITEGIYGVVNTSDLKTQKGQLTWGKAYELLTQKGYMDEQDYILAQMLSFRLCFCFGPHKKDTSILYFPSAFPKDFPGNRDGWKGGPMLHIRCQYNLLPTTIMGDFMIRMKRYLVPDFHWYDGCLLQDAEEGLEALIEQNRLENQIDVRIKGTGNKRIFWRAISDAFMDVHQQFDRLNADWKIPLPPPSNGGYVSLDTLKKLQSKNRKEYTDHEVNDYRISDLLGEIEAPTKTKKELELARELVEKRRFEDAFALLEKLEVKDPNFEVLLSSLKSQYNAAQAERLSNVGDPEAIDRKFNAIVLALLEQIRYLSY